MKQTKATIDSLRDEVKTMNKNFKNLEADMSISRNINYPLLKRVVDRERQCWANSHYSRRKCFEIAALPTSIP